MKPLQAVAVLVLVISAPLAASEQSTNNPPAQHPDVSAKDILSRQAAYLDKADHDQQETHSRNLQLLTRLEALQQRQEQDVTRFEKIMETWERQQAQYQKYLDSLPH